MVLGDRCLPRFRWLFACVALAACGSLGCEAGADLRYHGRVRVAEGNYEVLSLHSDAHDEYAFARDRDHDGDLVVLPFHTKPCRIGAAPGYAVLQSERGLRIAVLDSDTGSANLRVLDERCKPQIDSIPDVVDLGYAGTRLLVTAADGRLFGVDPWTGEVHTISRAFTKRGSVVASADSVGALWLLEGDTLVLRDFEGHELHRAGRHVTEIAVSRDQLAMIFSDDVGLHELRGGGAKRLGPPGCQLRYEPWPSSKVSANVAMALSPCEQRDLVWYEADKVHQVADGVNSYFPRHYLAVDGSVENWIFYARPSEGPTTDAGAESHFMKPPDGPPSPIDVPISGRSTLHPVHLAGGVARYWLMTTAEAEPRFGLFTAPHGFAEVARQAHAVAVSPAGFVVLHDWVKGAGGTLSQLDSKGGLHELAHGVPVAGLLKWGTSKEADFAVTGLPAVDAVLHDYDPDSATGTLARIEVSGHLHDIARGVPASSPDAYITLVRGAQLIQAARDVVVLTYLHDFDPETNTGTLSLVAPDGRQVLIDKNVASYAPSGDTGHEGVLYATSGSGAHEVWFVRQ